MADTGDTSSIATETVAADDRDVPIKDLIQPSKLDDEALFSILKGWWHADSDHSSVWRAQANKDYDFRSGEQWSAEDKAMLDAQQRPTIVFNRVLTILKAVAGMEINGRHEITFLPRNTSDTAINEVLSAASKWMADGCDAEDEESSAFEDTATIGMGWVETRMDYIEEANGKYLEEKVDPRQMYWDRTAIKKNLTDARRLYRVKKMPVSEAMQMFPGCDRAELNATWAVDGASSEATKTLEQKRMREENTNVENYDDKEEVTVVHVQWWERVFYWKVANLQNNTTTTLEDAPYQQFQKRMKLLGADDMVKSVRLPKKVFKQAFLGSKLLKCEDSPVKNQFTWKCITGELNVTKGIWFGLIAVMRDPQMWSNKWLSQVLHILNTTAKGGILAEEDAFDGDQREFEDKYARPDAVSFVARGAIAGNKIMAKPGQGVTQGHVDLMQYAISSIRDTTGINLELLGQQDQNQPGILERYRKQAGMTILATLFDSLRRFRKQVGSLRLYYIQHYLSDGRLVRVVGPEGVQALPLLKDQCLGSYDVVVDDTPTSPNMKEQNWQIIQPLIGVFKDQLTTNPEILAALLEYSPLPSRVVEMVKTFAAQAKQDPQTQQLKQLGIAKLVAAISKDQSTAEMQNAKAGATEATAMYDVAMARNLLTKKNDDTDHIGQALTHLQQLADLRKSTQDTAHVAARTRSEHANADATNVVAMKDALTPLHEMQDGRPKPGTALIHHGLPAAARLPPGARQAPDGHHYVLDPGRPGRYMRVMLHG